MSVFLEKDISKATLELSKTIEIFLKSKDFLLNDKNTPLTKSIIQFLTNYHTDDVVQNCILKLILDNCLLAEKLSAGSFYLTLRYFLSLTNNFESFQQIDSLHPKITDLENLIVKLTTNNLLQNMIKESVILAGFQGKIIIEKSLNDNYSIELSNSNDFEVKTYENSQIRLEKPWIVCIDGYVESVSELNKLFEDAVDTKRQIVVFSSGFHSDVITTTQLNKKRQTMFVYPITVPFDIDNINSIADISIITGVQPVSNHLGDLISNTSLTNAKMVDEIVIRTNLVEIKNEKTKAQVAIHSANLLNKLLDSQVSDILEKRIKRLSGNKVTIRLPDNLDFIKNSQLIDSNLRSIKSILNFGICEDGIPFATKQISYKFANKIYDSLNHLGAIVKA